MYLTLMITINVNDRAELYLLFGGKSRDLIFEEVKGLCFNLLLEDIFFPLN